MVQYQKPGSQRVVIISSSAGQVRLDLGKSSAVIDTEMLSVSGVEITTKKTYPKTTLQQLVKMGHNVPPFLNVLKIHLVPSENSKSRKSPVMEVTYVDQNEMLQDQNYVIANMIGG